MTFWLLAVGEGLTLASAAAVVLGVPRSVTLPVLSACAVWGVAAAGWLMLSVLADRRSRGR